tara:strand:- start:269 stop:592 length:324 start_codon:yes stop_codon:yes gene_type:complete
VDKHQVEEEMPPQIPLSNHLQDQIPIIYRDLSQDQLDLPKITTTLRMQPSQVLTEELAGLVKDLPKILVQVPLIKDHLLKVHIPPQLGSQDQEITVQDLMINPLDII